ncbi:hypothetical protein GCM10010383_19810 [Streptomyces lomondensis]|uniref:Uncharacterized protein n=1 Tax=Streptomyces lomondensis TaxID=68229 RepID=A0ABQ2X0V1_9ACTN|nr:hypothetical protein GCM10010383_19810 [Streptomyces lomondensis]
MDEEQIRNMTANAVTVSTDQLERLGRDLHDIRREIGKQNAGELQSTLVGHETTRCGGVVPTRVVLPTPVPTELAYRLSASDLVHRDPVEFGLDQPTVGPPVRRPNRPTICRVRDAWTSPHGRPFVSDAIDTKTLATTMSNVDEKPGRPTR